MDYSLIGPLVDFIVGSLPVMKSLTGARRRDRFDQLLAPLVDKLELVHHFYTELYMDTRRRLSDLSRQTSLQYPPLPGELVEAELEAIRSDFFTARATDESLRLALRRDAQIDLVHTKWPEERRLLVVIAFYFLRPGWVVADDESLDREAQEAELRGGEKVWDSPSSRLYDQLRATNEPALLIDVLDRAQDELNRNFADVRRHFRYVQNAVLNKT